MAKKTVATLQGKSKRLTKVIKMVKSPKTGAYTFVEGVMAPELAEEACTSASLEPSYVLRAIGRDDELAHSSIRFTLGRWTTEEEIDYTIELVKKAIVKLRDLSPLWEMFKEGVDLSKIEWNHH